MHLHQRYHSPSGLGNIWFFMLAISCLNHCVADELGTAVRATIETASPSVVRIQTIGSAGNDEMEVSSQVTTGIVISDNGEILTSLFGFNGEPAAIFVEDAEGQRVAATIIAKDYLRKLVLLKCKDGQFSKASFSASHWPAVGLYSVAAGRMYPGTLASASLGIVSAVHRIHGMAIQTDAKISPVNFGGPLLDLNGQVLGILVPLSPRDSGEEIGGGVEWYDSGIGFAIPAIDALTSAEKLRTGNDLFPGVLGINPSTKNPLAKNFEVLEIFPDSPAAHAGLRQHDTVIEVNGKRIDRFGEFESIIKGAYAGDQLTLKIKRGDDELDTELQLVQKLKRPPIGFVGVIQHEVVKADNTAVGVRVSILPESPLATAGMPESAIITEWNGKPLTSVKDLSTHLRALTIGDNIKLAYKLEQSDNINTLTVVPEIRTPQVVRLTQTFVSNSLGLTNVNTVNWQRQQEAFKDDAGKVWYFAPPTEVENCGIAVLLSESKTPQELLLRKWDTLCKLNNLIIVVIQNEEDTEPGPEDSRLVSQALSVVAKDRQIDTDRVFLVADKKQAQLATELLLNPRLGQLRAAVFLDSRPQISGIPDSVITGKPPSILLISGQIQSRQNQALVAQAAESLRESGATVAQYKTNNDGNAEATICDWGISLKAR